MNLPVSLKFENAKGKIISVISDVSDTYKFPAFILERIVSDILADIRSQVKIEMLNDINSILENKEGERIDNDNKSES